MTVCIAAISMSPPTVILVTDRMVSMGDYGSDGMMFKSAMLSRACFALMAGDVAQATAVLRRAKTDLGYFTDSRSLQQVQSETCAAYRTQRCAHAEATLLAPFQMTIEEFKLTGRQTFSDKEHESIVDQIRSCDIGVELLIGGFDSGKPTPQPYIFTVKDPGVFSDFDKIGFWSIGSGHHTALGAMFASRYDTRESLELCLYKVLVAKFTAESATGVGKDTKVLLLQPGTPLPLWISSDTITEIRLVWEGLPKVPDGIEALIAKNLAVATTLVEELLGRKNTLNDNESSHEEKTQNEDGIQSE